jgi:two-component system, NarL family, sensor kinase
MTAMDRDTARRRTRVTSLATDARALRRRAPAPGGAHPARRALVQFVVSSAALLVVITTIGALLLKRVATGEALQDARSVTVAFSVGVLREHITPAVLDGDRAALADLDRAVRQRVLGRPIVRVKVWTPSGRIVYSDARALIGRRFPLPDDLEEALADNAVRADVSDLSRPENRLERGRGRLVEVYLPLRLADGRRVMVETYHPAGTIDAATGRIWRTFLPIPIALLIALAAAQLPLAWSHTRRARADADERERQARLAEETLQAERGRIAVEVHRGVVQELAGVAYQMQAAALGPEDSLPGAEVRGLLQRGAVVCRRSMTILRDLLPEHRPAGDAPDVATALDALAAPLRARGVAVDVLARVDVALPDARAQLVHRAVRETLRTMHAGARRVRVEVVAEDSEIAIDIEDDGRRAAADDDGQHGGRHAVMLRLAEAFAREGGTLTVTSERDAGTRVVARLPR